MNGKQLAFGLVALLLLSGTVDMVSALSNSGGGEVSTISFVTDSSWKCLDAEVDGWASVDFDDSWWDDAEELFYVESLGDAKAIWYPGSPMPSTAYFRKTIDIDDNKILTGRITLAVYGADGENVYIFVNDNYVGTSRGRFYPYGVKELDIAPYLDPGKNVIAAKAVFGNTKYWWALTGTIRSGTTTPTPTPVTPIPDATIPTTSDESVTIPIVQTPDVKVHIYTPKPIIHEGESIPVTLSAVNKITNTNDLHIQSIITIPSGLSVTSTTFADAAVGQYIINSTIKPGESKIDYIELNIKPNQFGTFVIIGTIVYDFGDYHGEKELALPITVMEKETISPPEPTPEEDTPGFEAIFAIFGILVVAYLVLRRKE
ncbi:MAG: PGF-CTERM sorting domain-containing protein [Halobacteriota archaeon]|nr:PGF-CTERM sorting domain-containing protein [Halobacteriota archaeon]